MPNWCNNNLIVNGDLVDITEFYNNCLIENTSDYKNTDKVLTFAGSVPEPKMISEEDQKEYDDKGWYNWRLENWGVKWEPNTNWYAFENGYLQIDFDTPWGSPTNWLETTSLKYPNLEFRLEFYELGMMFRGVTEAHNGIVSQDEWDITKEDIIELGYEPEDFFSEDEEDLVVNSKESN